MFVFDDDNGRGWVLESSRTDPLVDRSTSNSLVGGSR